MARIERTQARRASYRIDYPGDDVSLALRAVLVLVVLMFFQPQGALGLIRLLLALAFVLFLPGYSVVAAIYPERGTIDTPTRLGFGVGLSIAFVPILTVLLDRLPWGIRPWPILLAELSICAAGLGVAVWRRARLEPSVRYAPTLRGVPWVRGAAWLAIACGTVIFAYGVTAPSRAAPPTEFYILGADGLAQGYPREVAAGADVSVIAGITSYEPGVETFHIEIWQVDRLRPERRVPLGAIPPVTLRSGERLEQVVPWRFNHAGQDQLVELQLVRAGDEQPYRRLELILDVVPSEAATEPYGRS